MANTRARRASPLIPILLAPLLTAAVQAQELPVRGRVVSANDGAAVNGATVEVIGMYRSAVAGPDGSFILWLPGGHWQLRVGHIGFRSDTVEVIMPADGAAEPR